MRGKTQVSACWVADLIQQDHSNTTNLAVVTFTNKLYLFPSSWHHQSNTQARFSTREQNFGVNLLLGCQWIEHGLYLVLGLLFSDQICIGTSRGVCIRWSLIIFFRTMRCWTVSTALEAVDQHGFLDEARLMKPSRDARNKQIWGKSREKTSNPLITLRKPIINQTCCTEVYSDSCFAMTQKERKKAIDVPGF